MSEAVAEAPPETAASEPTNTVDSVDQSLLNDVMGEMGMVPPEPESSEEATEAAGPSVETEATEDKGEEQEEATETEEKAPKEKLDAKTQAKIDRRISKEVAKRKELESQLADQTAYISELKGKVEGKADTASVPVNPNDPFGGLTGKQLDERDKEAKEFILWANKGPLEEGHEQALEDGETKYWTPEEIKEQYNAYQENVLIKIPEARKKADRAVESLNRVAERYPELQDDKSEDFQRFAQVWNSEVVKAARSVSSEDAAWLVAYVVEGMKGGKSKPAPEPPKSSPPKIPVSTAPAGPSPIRGGSKGVTTLSESDFQQAANGDLDSVVAKLLK